MTSQITIHKAGGKWVVRAGGAVLAESGNALEVTTTDGKATIYFPRADVAMAFLDQSENGSTCPDRGAATHYAIETKSQTIGDAAWSYEAPKAGFEQIAGFLAFHNSDKVAVEQL